MGKRCIRQLHLVTRSAQLAVYTHSLEPANGACITHPATITPAALAAAPTAALLAPPQVSLLPRTAAPRLFHQRRSFSISFASQQPHGGDDGAETAFREVAEAFDRLITAAYELLEQGKPAEAEYLLREGAKQAEELMGEGAVEVAPLYDQLALVQLMHDRCVEALQPAKHAWDIMAAFAEQEGSLSASGAAAAAAVRFATVAVGAGEAAEALPVLQQAGQDLDAALQKMPGQVPSGGQVDPEALEEVIDKFETARGECRFYAALCALGLLDSPTSGDVEQATAELEAGLMLMQQGLGRSHPLIACALREHNKLTQAAVEAERGELAEALYRQEVRLHQSYDRDSEHVASLLYQLGTLQYCRGRYIAAVATLERCLSMVRLEFEGGEEHVLTVKHRLGMALGAGGQHAQATAVLNSIAAELVQRLGLDNPVSCELDFMVSLMGLKQAADPLARERMVAVMGRSLEKLGEYGEGHMLVKSAKQMYQTAFDDATSTAPKE